MPPLLGSDAHILILGTMPGEQSLLKQQYYGNRGNHFWRLIFDVFDAPFSDDYDFRSIFIKSKGIALWDALQSCERSGSLDSNISQEFPNDFEAFFSRHPQFTHVFFSSKAAEKYYDRFAKRHSTINYSTLPSPSGANASKSFAQKLEAWKVLRQVTEEI